MIYKFMRMIVFFDLPMNSKKEVRTYTQFRKFLIKSGFTMMQFSIYSKVFNNVDAVNAYAKILRKNVPMQGQIRIMTITEKQYNDIEIIIGGKSRQEEKITIDPFILF